MNMLGLRLSLLGSAVLALAACTTPVGGMNSSSQVAATRPSNDVPSTAKGRTAAKTHVKLGQAYLDVSRMGVALDEANMAIALDPSYPLAHLLKAMVYAEMEQNGVAKASFEEAVRLAPGDADINAAYGWFLCIRGQLDEGIERLESAARNPYYEKPARAWSNAGLCYLSKKKEAEAEDRFARAATLDDNEVVPRYYLADMALRSNRLPRAKVWIDQIMSKQASVGADVLWLALRIERKVGNEAAVKTYAERLKTDFSGTEEYQSYLQGKFE